MALAIPDLRASRQPRRRLQAAPDPEPLPGGLSLADRLAAAQAAAEPARRRVAELEARLSAAVDQADFTTAGDLQGQLPRAREALALAEVEVRGLTEAQARVEQRTADDQQAITEQQRRADARQRLESALAGERRARSHLTEDVEQLYAALTTAQDVYQRALAWEQKAGNERRRAHEARVDLGEAEAIIRLSKPDQATVLQDRDPLVRLLIRWRRPR